MQPNLGQLSSRVDTPLSAFLNNLITCQQQEMSSVKQTARQACSVKLQQFILFCSKRIIGPLQTTKSHWFLQVHNVRNQNALKFLPDTTHTAPHIWHSVCYRLCIAYTRSPTLTAISTSSKFNLSTVTMQSPCLLLMQHHPLLETFINSHEREHCTSALNSFSAISP